MPIYYQCKKCGKLVKGQRACTPARGDYARAKCECGNKGVSDWHYVIEGFTKLASKEQWMELKKALGNK
jgi:hypothetical protein